MRRGRRTAGRRPTMPELPSLEAMHAVSVSTEVKNVVADP
jgi:hypothetical protein